MSRNQEPAGKVLLLKMCIAGLMLAMQWSCALAVEQRYQRMRPDLLAHRYDQAVRWIEKGKHSFYGRHNALLYHMDRGAVASWGHDFRTSNQSLENAKAIANRLWSTSISQEVGSWFVNDNVMEYRGEEFEMTMLHLLEMFNYLQQHQWDEAMVEARQLNNQSVQLKHEHGESFSYHQDAFALWISGFLRMHSRSPDACSEAWIDFKKSIQVYEKVYAPRYDVHIPDMLIQDAYRCLMRLGLEYKQDLQHLAQRYEKQLPKIPKSLQQPPQKRPVVIIIQSGEAPYKQEAYWTALVGPNIIHVAYPVFTPKPHASTGMRVRSKQPHSQWVKGEALQDISAIAMTDLHEHLERVKDKAIARAVANFSAGVATEIAGSQMRSSAVGLGMMAAGWLWNWGHAAMEHADTRSWITLPAMIYAAQIETQWPTHLEIVLEDANQRALEQWTVPIEARSEPFQFVILRSFY